MAAWPTTICLETCQVWETWQVWQAVLHFDPQHSVAFGAALIKELKTNAQALANSRLCS